MLTQLHTNKGVEFARFELARVATDYQLLADCLEGERAVKGMLDNDVSSHLGSSVYINQQRVYASGNVVNETAARRYLPKPEANNESDENSVRYDAYVTRAVFYNATARTLDGYLGQLFQREPIVEVPDKLAVVAKDSTGERVSIKQLMKETTAYVLPYGRSGLLADYPKTDGGTTLAQQQAGMARPILRTYAPWDITNWRERQIGSARVLELVVLREEYSVIGEDGFELETHWQYRELALNDAGVYGVRIWRREADSGTYVSSDWSYPQNYAGEAFTSIPFFFIGSGNNDPKIDRPPFLDIAKVNIGHYRNSADYEEASYMCGQPTPVFSGMTEDWHRDVLKGQVYLGARASVSLPVGGTAMLLQADPNTMPHEAMLHKEKQLVTLGARISEQPDVMRTATEATISAVEASSPLLSTAANVSVAYRDALVVCAEFAGVAVTDKNLKVSITSEATLQMLSTAERQQQIVEIDAGVLSFEEVRENLRRSGVATLPDADVRKLYDAAVLRKQQSMTEPEETDDGKAEIED